MAIPDLSPFYNMHYTEHSGFLTPQAMSYNDDVFQTLNQLIDLVNDFVTSDWIAAANKTTAEITALEPSAPLGAIFFNTDTAKLQVKTAAGTIETITSS